MNVQQPSDSPRFPLAVPPANRFSSLDKDSKIVNCFIEKGPQENDLWVYQRPGLSLYASIGGTGRGVFNWNASIYAVFGGNLYKDGVSLGAVQAAGIYTFSVTLGTVPKLFLRNGAKAYTYDATSGLVELTYATTITTTGTTHTTAVIDGIPSTAGMAPGMGVSGVGIPLGAAILTVDSGVQITLTVATTSSVAGLAITVTGDGFPTSTVPGQAYLDGTTYVMTPGARIYGSEINDPRTWDALNFLTAQVEPDGGVAMGKQLVYVIAFKQWSTEVFYDRGNAAGSPLAPVQGAKVNLGCRAAGSVQNLDDTLLWVTSTRAGSVGAARMDGLKAQPIAYPSIERLLERADNETVFSWSGKTGGHKFYGVTFKNANISMVYDLTVNTWYQWTDASGNYLPWVSSTYAADQQVLVQHETNGNLYLMDDSFVTDAGVGIPCRIVTPNWDGGTTKPKILNRLDVVGDEMFGGMLLIRCNDYDYDPAKWTNWRRVDMAAKRPHLSRCGTFNRRAYDIQYNTSSGRLRLKAFELNVDLGTV